MTGISLAGGLLITLVGIPILLLTLSHLLQQSGLGVTTLSRDAITGRNLARLERQGVALICLGAFLLPLALNLSEGTPPQIENAR